MGQSFLFKLQMIIVVLIFTCSSSKVQISKLEVLEFARACSRARDKSYIMSHSFILLPICKQSCTLLSCDVPTQTSK